MPHVGQGFPNVLVYTQLTECESYAKKQAYTNSVVNMPAIKRLKIK